MTGAPFHKACPIVVNVQLLELVGQSAWSIAADSIVVKINWTLTTIAQSLMKQSPGLMFNLRTKMCFGGHYF